MNGRPLLTGGPLGHLAASAGRPYQHPTMSPCSAVWGVGSQGLSLCEPHAWRSDCAFRELAKLDVAPERDQQLPGQRHDPDFSQPLTASPEARLVIVDVY